MVRTDKQVYCFNPDGKEWPIEYIIDAGWDLNDDEPKYLCKWLNFHKSFSDWQYEKNVKDSVAYEDFIGEHGRPIKQQNPLEQRIQKRKRKRSLNKRKAKKVKNSK